MSFFDTLKEFFADWKEKRRIEAARRAEERRKREEAERKRIEHERAMYRKGNDFEDYAITMFPESDFVLIHRTPTNDETGGRYVHDMIYPDLRFIDRATGKKFWVEVKYRSHAEPDGSIIWCADNQLTNYKRTMYQSRDKVFILMGVGGTVSDPDKVYILDLENINFVKLFYSTYKGHRVMSRTVESLEQIESIANHH